MMSFSLEGRKLFEAAARALIESTGQANVQF